VQARYAAIVASVAAHAAAVAWLADRAVADAPREIVDEDDEDDEADPPPDEPMIVALVEPTASVEAMPPVAPAVGRAALSASSPARRSRESRPVELPSALALVGAITPAAEPAKPGDGPPHRPAMSMRADEIRSHHLEDTINRAADAPPGTPPPPVPEINGAAHAHDREIKELDALEVSNPTYRATATPWQLEVAEMKLDEMRKEREHLSMRPDGHGGYRNDHETFAVRVDGDGTVNIQDKPNVRIASPFEIKFDVNDAIMRHGGEDPYKRVKMDFLDKTRDERAELGRRWRKVQLGHADELMQKNIDRLWGMTRDPRKLRAGLFELWDDCAETGDDDLVEAGARARRLVVGVIRARLPERYSAAELAELNKHKRSKAKFAPYDD
jgi:hypothetical protein